MQGRVAGPGMLCSLTTVMGVEIEKRQEWRTVGVVGVGVGELADLFP